MVRRLSLAASRLRCGFFLACAALLLAACGGGGDEGRHLTPGERPLQGSWVLEVTERGVGSAAVDVSLAAVPDEDDVEDLDAADIAALVGMTLYPETRYEVTVTGRRVHVENLTDTDYTVTIDSVRTSNFQDCGTCTVGSTIRFDATLAITETGNLDGVPQSDTGAVLTFTYRRTV